jgi:hypothetical protein
MDSLEEELAPPYSASNNNASAEEKMGEEEPGVPAESSTSVFELMYMRWLGDLQPQWYTVMVIENNWQAWLMVDQNRYAKEFPYQTARAREQGCPFVQVITVAIGSDLVVNCNTCNPETATHICRNNYDCLTAAEAQTLLQRPQQNRCIHERSLLQVQVCACGRVCVCFGASLAQTLILLYLHACGLCFV